MTNSRRIKFRAWNSEGKCFYTDSFVRTNLFNLLEKTNEPVMQFTGLLDKNGKEIYEGDIVRAIGEDKNRIQIIVVERDEQTKGFSHPLWKVCQKFLEVIGNLYENPELLKVAEK